MQPFFSISFSVSIPFGKYLFTGWADGLVAIYFSLSVFLTYILLIDEKSLATLPLALQFVAMALTTIPASLYMGRFGRKVGFITGALIGVCGGALGAYAITQGDFALFCIASLLTGSFNGFCHYFRFAAADVSTPEYRSKAISYVLAGSIVAAVLGPTLARNTAEIMPVQFAGVYLALIGVYLIVGCVASFIDIPKPADEQRKSGDQRQLFEIARQPKFIIAVCAATSGEPIITAAHAKELLAGEGRTVKICSVSRPEAFSLEAILMVAQQVGRAQLRFDYGDSTLAPMRENGRVCLSEGWTLAAQGISRQRS